MNFNSMEGCFQSFQGQNTTKKQEPDPTYTDVNIPPKSRRQRLEDLFANTDELTELRVKKQQKEMYLLWTSYFSEEVGKFIPSEFASFIGNNMLPELMQKLFSPKKYTGYLEERFLKYLIDNQKKRTASYSNSPGTYIEFDIEPGYVCGGWNEDAKQPIIVKIEDYLNKIVKSMVYKKYSGLSLEIKECLTKSYDITSEETDLQARLKQKVDKLGFNSPSTIFRLITYSFFKKKGWEKETFANKERSVGVDKMEKNLTKYIDLFVTDFKRNYISFFDPNDVKSAKRLAILNYKKRHEEDQTVANSLVNEKHRFFSKNKSSKNIFVFLKGSAGNPNIDRATLTLVKCFYNFHLTIRQEHLVSFDSFLRTLKEAVVISIRAESELDPLRCDELSNRQHDETGDSPVPKNLEYSDSDTSQKILEFKKKWFGLPYL